MYHLTPIQIQQKNMYFTQVQNHKVFVTKLSKLLVHIELFWYKLSGWFQHYFLRFLWKY